MCRTVLGLSGNEKDFKNYSNPDNDKRGPWVLGDLTVGMTASMRPNQAYNLIDHKTGTIYPFNPKTSAYVIGDEFSNAYSSNPYQNKFWLIN